MAKELDKYKLRQLFDVFKNAMLWAWYLAAITLGATLWYFPLPSTNLQTFAFCGVFVFYTLLSVCIAKVDSIRTELE